MLDRTSGNLKIFWAITIASCLAAGVAPLFSQETGKHPVSGRQIAPVMSYRGADWLERPERQQEEDPTSAIKALGLKPGMVAADIGCGTGYFARRMAREVAPTGKVYGVDIQPEMIALLKEQIKAGNISNLEPVLATADDPKLPEKSLDLAIMVDVYHELSDPRTVLAKLRQALKDDGRLVLLEYRKEDPGIPIRLLHKMTVDEAKLELQADGFRLDQVIETLPRQHILIFKKQSM